MPRLILFDIDETMIHSSGAGRKALTRALSEIFGHAISFDGISLSGKTDPQIIAEVLIAHGYTEDHATEVLEQVFSIYLPYLEEEVREAEEFRVHEGVFALLDALQSTDAYVGLLTGNIEPGARIKLRPFDLNRYFEFGAFGCDSGNRMELPAVAHKRAEQKFNAKIDRNEIVIIGDAQNDVLCAKGYGARALAVCTGRTTKQTLSALEPHYLFDTLKETAQVLDAIFAE